MLNLIEEGLLHHLRSDYIPVDRNHSMTGDSKILDIRSAWLYFCTIPMCMENVLPTAVLAAERSAMTGAYQSVGTLQYRIPLVLLPRSHRAVRGGIAYSVVLAFKMVGRIYQIVNTVFLQQRRAFRYSGRLVLRESHGSSTLTHSVSVSGLILIRSSVICATQITLPSVKRTK